MQYSVVNYKTVKENSDFRIDSEFYHPVILNRLNLLDHKRNEQLGKLVEFVVGPFGSTVTVDKYVDESDYRYIRNKDINNFVISDNDPALIPEIECFLSIDLLKLTDWTNFFVERKERCNSRRLEFIRPERY
jgi:hypothetical protein